jgi:protein SCO1/2
MTRRALLASIVLSFAAACSRHGESGFVDPEPAPEVHGLAVVRGAPFDLRAERGKVVVLSFGYTSCAEICPETFSTMKSVLRDLGPASSELLFAYVTVDPERDRPEVLKAFIESVDPRFEGVFAEGDALASVLSGYHVTVRKRLPDPSRYAKRDVDPSAFYSMDHTAGFWGVDRRGRLRFKLTHDATPASVTEATRRLVEEEDR